MRNGKIGAVGRKRYARGSTWRQGGGVRKLEESVAITFIDIDKGRSVDARGNGKIVAIGREGGAIRSSSRQCRGISKFGKRVALAFVDSEGR